MSTASPSGIPSTSAKRSVATRSPCASSVMTSRAWARVSTWKQRRPSAVQPIPFDIEMPLRTSSTTPSSLTRHRPPRVPSASSSADPIHSRPCESQPPSFVLVPLTSGSSASCSVGCRSAPARQTPRAPASTKPSPGRRRCRRPARAASTCGASPMPARTCARCCGGRRARSAARARRPRVAPHRARRRTGPPGWMIESPCVTRPFPGGSLDDADRLASLRR